MEISRGVSGSGCVSESRGVESGALPPNVQLQLPVKSVKPFAEQRARYFRPQRIPDVDGADVSSRTGWHQSEHAGQARHLARAK